MKRLLDAARPYTSHILTTLAVVLTSSALFAVEYRNDLLILCAQLRKLSAANALILAGATAASATETFPEPALIEYLHTLSRPDAPSEESARMTELLLQAGASPRERSTDGRTPLMLASGAGKTDVVVALLRAGADMDARARGTEQQEGMTALMAAAVNGHTPVVQLLVDRGANIHLRSRAGFTALLLAASRGHLGAVDVLLEKGASVPLSTVQVAQRNGHAAVAARLLEATRHPRAFASRRPAAQTPEE